MSYGIKPIIPLSFLEEIFVHPEIQNVMNIFISIKKQDFRVVLLGNLVFKYLYLALFISICCHLVLAITSISTSAEAGKSLTAKALLAG